MAEEDTFSTKITCCTNCVKLKESFLKLKERKDLLRNTLQNVVLPKIDELQNEIANLKKAYEAERTRADLENEEKERESSLRVGLEKEILNLKSEIASLQQDSASRDLDDDCEVILLRARVSELDGEIYHLKELLEEERQKGEVEEKGKLKESSVGDGLENEILKSEKDSFPKNTATTNLGENSEVILLRSRVSEGQAEISRISDLIDNERKNVVLEKEKLEADKRKAQEALKIEVEARSKECSVRAGLENEILNLKSKIGLLKEESTSRDQEEITHLQARLAEADAESNRLKELFNDERKKADSEKKKAEAEKKKAEAKKTEIEAKMKESACLENEIKKLKFEMASLQEKKDSRDEDGETLMLRSCVSKGELENKRLNELLVKERKRVDSEKKRAEMERKKSSDALELVKSERKKAEEEKRLADVERTCAEKCRISLEATRIEANELRAKLVLERSRIEEAYRRAEAEKQMAYREKKRAESEMVKAEEQKKFVEEGKKKLMDEKDRSKNLSQKLEEARQRIESLEKELQEIMSARTMKQNLPVTSEVNRNVEGNLLLLEEQLRLEKMQVKHAKRVSKFEKKRNNLLGQELYRLKQDFGYFCYRLNVLDGCFSNGIEGIDASAKRNNFLKIQSSNETDKLSGKEPFSLYGKSKNEHVKARYTSMDWFDRFRSTVECSTPLSDASGSSTKPISGISSTLESLIGGSVRNKLQNSAICSTSTSFSDRPSVGSQENNTLNISRLDSLVENLKTGPIVPTESAKLTINENNVLVDESCVKTPLYRDIEDPCFRLNKHDSIKDVGKETGQKRKRLPDEVGSLECMCTELLNLPTELEEKVTPPNNALTLANNMPPPISSHIGGCNAFGDGRCPTAFLLGDVHSRNHRSSKKGKVSEKQNSNLEPANNIDVYEWAANLQTEISNGGGNFNQIVLQTNCLIETIETSRDTVDTAGINKKVEVSIENMSSEDIMKLLELDDPDDEEKFRMAMEMPLSPTLPEIEMPNMEDFEVDTGIISKEGTSGGMTKEINTTVLSGCFNALNDARDPNKLNFESSGNVDYSMLPQLEGLHSAIGELPYENVEFNFSTDAGNGISSEVSDTSIQLEMTKEVSRSEVMEAPRTSNKEPMHVRTSKYFVVFPNNKDKNSICRIITAQETCLLNSAIVSEKVWMVQNILVALVKEKDLLPEEKACVFFSLLLHNFLVVTSENLRKCAADDIYSCSNSLLTCMKTVMSDAGIRNILLELFGLDTLLTLIESFLIDKRVTVYNNVEPHVQSDSQSITLLDGTHILLSSEAATTDKLVAGSFIMASICATTGHIGFICEASYRFLRAHRSDSHLTLIVLHVFAFLCGDKYFTLNSHSLIMAVVRSIVTFLEKGTVTIDATCGSFIRLGREGRFTFSPCAQCLFSKDVLSVDEVLILLLEKLQFYAGIEPGFHASFPINKNWRFDSSQSDYFGGSISQHLDDIFSLVELLAYYKGWEWTRSKVIPQLIKIVESCVSEKVSTAVILLIGQLGRFGIDRSGCEQLGVEDLRCSLAVFLNQKTTRNRGRPTQFAVVRALMGLLSVNFEELIENKDLSVDNSQLIHVNLLRAWFSQLSEEQKSSSLLILTQC
ncbi:maternal effect embryo arrest [Thalictrum thalictroides]|uniref:Maternal effect embryo arrest n=1 Tax=Thalictrum thalictroides TaxID=46969 RepID=A0A7J6WHN1_THATH|nr:maternal effect embryo arrest [Thalictrum thalictroides]